jgi:hypothetical protein
MKLELSFEICLVLTNFLSTSPIKMVNTLAKTFVKWTFKFKNDRRILQHNQQVRDFLHFYFLNSCLYFYIFETSRYYFFIVFGITPSLFRIRPYQLIKHTVTSRDTCIFKENQHLFKNLLRSDRLCTRSLKHINITTENKGTSK